MKTIIKTSFLGIAVMLSVAGMQAQPITAGEHTRVNTVYGPIEGYLDGSIYTFKGIKYAKAERFMPPEAPDKFTQLRQCKLYGPQAPQNESLRWNGNNQSDYAFGNQFVVEPMDEKECLVLNVWTPSINDQCSCGSTEVAMPAALDMTSHAMRAVVWPRPETSWW